MARLTPGDDYSRLKQLLNDRNPEKHTLLTASSFSGYLYQFQRPWEIIQMAVDDSGTVMSVEVFATDPEFRPNFVGDRPSPLGESLSSFSRAYGDNFQQVEASFGAHATTYLEMYEQADNAHGDEQISVGFANTLKDLSGSMVREDSQLAQLYEACPLGNMAESFKVNVRAMHTPCLDPKAEPVRTLRKQVQISAVIVAAPGQALTADMLIIPYQMPNR